MTTNDGIVQGSSYSCELKASLSATGDTQILNHIITSLDS